MKHRLKKLKDQVIVITGASSGIGLVTARMAARYGSRLVLAARSEEALQELRNELASHNCECETVVADVSKEEDHQRIVQAAINRFGGFDTWVNNAGTSIYGKVLEISTEDLRQLIDTNLWSVVYGSRAACGHLRQRGGALINLGSTVSDRAIPLQGMYSASKHAVKGFTDALRMELEEERAPISVTLIKPGSIDTPFPDHAKNYMDNQPTLPPPVYAPELVAEAILHAAEHGDRELFIGSGGAAIAGIGRYAPRLADVLMEKTLFKQQQKDEPAKTPDGALYTASEDLRERGDYQGVTREMSFYTKAAMHPLVSTAIFVAAGIAAAQLLGASFRTSEKDSTEYADWSV